MEVGVGEEERIKYKRNENSGRTDEGGSCWNQSGERETL